MWRQQQKANGVPDVPRGEPFFPCWWDQCSAVFDSGEALFGHICDEHIALFSPWQHVRRGKLKTLYTCKWANCGVTVHKRDHLVSHVRVHIDMWPYSCTTCSKKFRRQQDLKKHFSTSLHKHMVHKWRYQKIKNCSTILEKPSGISLGATEASLCDTIGHSPRISRKKSLENIPDLSLEYSSDILTPTTSLGSSSSEKLLSATSFEDQYLEFYKQFEPQEPNSQTLYHKVESSNNPVFGVPIVQSCAPLRSISPSDYGCCENSCSNEVLIPEFAFERQYRTFFGDRNTREKHSLARANLWDQIFD